MSKYLILPLSVVGLALLAACGSRQPQVVVVPSAPVVTTAPAASAPVAAPVVALRPGFGRIESMSPVATASAGGTSPAAMQRLNIRMDDNSMQVVDTPSADLKIGDRVELTREGYIRRIPQS
jgi:hypothetical protein